MRKIIWLCHDRIVGQPVRKSRFVHELHRPSASKPARVSVQGAELPKALGIEDRVGRFEEPAQGADLHRDASQPKGRGASDLIDKTERLIHRARPGSPLSGALFHSAPQSTGSPFELIQLSIEGDEFGVDPGFDHQRLLCRRRRHKG